MFTQKDKSNYFQAVLKDIMIFFLPLSALVAAILTSYYYSETRAQRILTENSTFHQVTLAKEIIASEYVSPISDLYLISEDKNFQKIFESDYNSEWTNRLVKDLSLIFEVRGVYSQIRVLDETGMERIKIININGRPFIISKEKLQSKAQRYYFKMAYALDKGEIYVSPFDLNIEDGEIERPLNPIIRFATPLFDNQGKKRGILIFNYLGEGLQENVRALSSNDPGNIMIVNNKGFWLLGARTEDEWGFMLEERQEKTFERSFPDGWKQITATNSGSFSNAEGVFSFDTVHTLQVREKAGTPGSKISNRNHYLSKFQEKYWKIIYHVPPVIMKAKSSTLQKNLFFLFAIISTPLVLGTWFMAYIKIQHKLEFKKSHLLSGAVEHDSNSVIITDISGNIEYVNPGFTRLTGYSLSDIIGENTKILKSGETPLEEYKKLWDTILSDREWYGKFINKKRNGEICEVSSSIFPVKNKKGIIKHFVGIQIEVTSHEKKKEKQESFRTILEDAGITINSGREIKQLARIFDNAFHELQNIAKSRASLEKIIQERTSQLTAAKEGLENKTTELEKANEELRETTVHLVQSEKLTALGELTAGVVHEMNQPLNVIKIISQSQLRDIEKDRFDIGSAKEDLPEIISQVNRMSEIIDHMRIFSRRTEETVKEKIDVNSVIKNTFIFLGAQLKGHNIELIEELSPDLPKIQGDGIRIEQVFMNLITNARHALEQSGKENKRIGIKTYLFDAQKAVVAEVSDNADGIPEDLQKKIFQAFMTTKEKGKGTGLGLSISKKIVEEHKGRIELESKVGEGTVFRVVFPAVED